MKETVTLGSIYELQGFRDEAIAIYKKVLSKDPTNTDAKLALKRLSGQKKRFVGVNDTMKRFFIDMDNQFEFNEFERWLTKIWR